mmetsp:Transcript_44747/g.106221  ORF Transcript_44747/g.106221 Transcript_44747/m.106221 type:complete len:126 (-) Transcript_44747:6682-7059(-)
MKITKTIRVVQTQQHPTTSLFELAGPSRILMNFTGSRMKVDHDILPFGGEIVPVGRFSDAPTSFGTISTSRVILANFSTSVFSESKQEHIKIALQHRARKPAAADIFGFGHESKTTVNGIGPRGS